MGLLGGAWGGRADSTIGAAVSTGASPARCDATPAADLAASILTQRQRRDDSAAVRCGAAFVFGDDVDAHVPALGALRPAPGREGARRRVGRRAGSAASSG